MTNPAAFLSSFAGVSTLVTGHTGFKGSWLSHWLLHLGAQVTGLALDPEEGDASFFSKLGLEPNLTSIIGDVRDQHTVDAVLDRASPEIVFHLAAQPLVRRSYIEPVLTFDTNVMGTAHVLDACRRTQGVKAIVIVTSDKAYANPETGIPIPEGSPKGGHDPYSASKGAAELVTAAYRRSFFSSTGDALVASARAGNVIGAGDASVDRLLPDIVRSIRAAQPVVIRNPESTRPWQHVLEPLRGYLMLGAALLDDNPDFAGGWNFGPRADDIITVGELARLVIERWGDGVLHLDDESSGPHEARLLSLDTTKAREQLGFEPVLDVATAVAYTVDGYRDLAAGKRAAHEVLTGQITEYERLLR